MNAAPAGADVAVETAALPVDAQARPVAAPHGKSGRWAAAVRKVYEHREVVVVAAGAIVFLAAITPQLYNLPKASELQKEIGWLTKENAELRKINEDLRVQLHWMRGAAPVLQRAAAEAEYRQLSNTAVPGWTYLLPLAAEGAGNVVRREIASAKRMTPSFPIVR